MLVHYNDGYGQKEKELVREAMKIWRISAREYRETEENYAELVAKQRKLGIHYRALPRSVDKQRPRIPFFLFVTEHEARNYLAGLDISGKRRLVNELKKLPDHYSYNSFRAYVHDLGYTVRNHGANKGGAIGVDPNHDKFVGTHRTPTYEW
ncbi:hypothetical protein IKG60_00990 [Candidatus Saccharibacteria bacterium]|nr:hypothetical protein [Candidatus Saccharibacteria bacterium]